MIESKYQTAVSLDEARTQPKDVVSSFLHDFRVRASTLPSDQAHTTAIEYSSGALELLKPEQFTINRRHRKQGSYRVFATDLIKIDSTAFTVEALEKVMTPSLKFKTEAEGETFPGIGFSFITIKAGALGIGIKGSNSNRIPGNSLSDEQIKAFNVFLSKINLPVD